MHSETAYVAGRDQAIAGQMPTYVGPHEGFRDFERGYRHGLLHTESPRGLMRTAMTEALERLEFFYGAGYTP